jgi:hypothetical protein
VFTPLLAPKLHGSNKKVAKLPKAHPWKIWDQTRVVWHGLASILSRGAQCRQTRLGATISSKLGQISPWNSHELDSLGVGKKSYTRHMARFARLGALQAQELGKINTATCSTRPGNARARPGARPRARCSALRQPRAHARVRGYKANPSLDRTPPRAPNPARARVHRRLPRERRASGRASPGHHRSAMPALHHPIWPFG